MDYLHYDFHAGPSDVIEITLDHAANVLLLDAQNYDAYRQGRQYRYRGGYVRTTPFRISPPTEGHWHIVINLGGAAGSVRASARVLGSHEAAI